MAVWTQADIDTLRAAIKGGGVLQSMTFGETTFTFRSLKDMLTLLSIMEQDVNGSKTRFAATSKGA